MTTRQSHTAANDGHLRILMVAPTSFFKDYGGHIRILEETLALQAGGQSVTIVTYYIGNDVPGIDIRRTAPLPYRAEYEVGSSRHKLAFDVYLAAKTLSTGLRIRPDIVHGHMHEGALIGGILARLLRVPLVFDFQGSLSGEMVDHEFLKPDGFFFRLVAGLEKVICRMPDAILTSSLQAETLLSDQFGVKRETIQPLPDCVDTARFNPGRFDDREKLLLRQRLGIPADHSIITYLGLLADYQGIPEIIEAARRLKNIRRNVHFLIMGYPRVDQYRALAERLGAADIMTFTGKIHYDDAPLYLSIGEISVSAKMSATEGSGKVLNYMAMEQPVVAFDTTVHREYLDELGLYAPPGDAAALAVRLDELLENPARARSIGASLRRRAVESYSWQKAGEIIIDLYRRLIDDRK